MALADAVGLFGGPGRVLCRNLITICARVRGRFESCDLVREPWTPNLIHGA
jgi:hypothetical protein